jgi:outer membrane autotransporter protein
MNGEPMTTKHVTITSRTSRQLPYMLVCVMSIFLGVSGVAQGQVTPRPTPIPPPSFEEFGNTFCQNPNAAAVGAAIDSAKKRLAEVPPNDSKGRSVIELLTFKSINQKDELCELLDDRIPAEEVTAVFTLGFSQANIQSDNLSRRMLAIRSPAAPSATGFTINSGVREFSMGLAGPTGPEGKSGPPVVQPPPQNRWGFFVTGIGEFTKVDDTSVAHGYYLPTGGVIFGADYLVSPHFAIGLTGGYSHTNGDLLYSSLDVDNGTIGAYATAFGGGFYVNGAVTGVFDDYETHRDAFLGTASGDTNGRDFNALVATGYEWRSGGLTIGPTFSYQYTYVEFDGFTEHGSLLPLTFPDQNANSSRTALGGKISYDWHVGHAVVRPEFRAAWQHEFGDTENSIIASFANGAGNSFSVNGPEIGRDSLLIGAGAAVIFNDRVSVYAYYDGELARTNYSSNNVSAGVRVSF